MSVSGMYDDIMVGAEVFGSDGDKVGRVAEVYPGYITVEKGFFFPTDYYIPRNAVQSARDGQVYLTVSKDAALQSGWDVIPANQDMVAATTDVVADDTMIETRQAMAAPVAEDEIHIPVMEEELTATVRPREAGEVRIEKRVVEEDRVLDVPVTEEQIRVERRVVDRPVDAADVDAFEEIVVEVPLHEETVDVQKHARVKEDIVVSKEAVQHTERVADTVRREEVFVDDDTRMDEVRP